MFQLNILKKNKHKNKVYCHSIKTVLAQATRTVNTLIAKFNKDMLTQLVYFFLNMNVSLPRNYDAKKINVFIACYATHVPNTEHPQKQQSASYKHFNK